MDRVGQRRRCRAAGGAKNHGGPAGQAALPQQSGPRSQRDHGSLIRYMADGRVVGIDLGTTNSLVAYMEGDKPVVIPGVDGSNLVPSVVALDPISAEGGRPTGTGGHRARRAVVGAR